VEDRFRSSLGGNGRNRAQHYDDDPPRAVASNGSEQHRKQYLVVVSNGWVRLRIARRAARRSPVGQSRREAAIGIICARRACTVSMVRHGRTHGGFS
jgi:hypothetical protein